MVQIGVFLIFFKNPRNFVFNRDCRECNTSCFFYGTKCFKKLFSSADLQGVSGCQGGAPIPFPFRSAKKSPSIVIIGVIH